MAQSLVQFRKVARAGELDRVTQVPGGFQGGRARGCDVRRAAKPVDGLLPDTSDDCWLHAMGAHERSRLPVVVRDEFREGILPASGARLEPCRRGAVEACALGSRQRLISDLPDQDVAEGHAVNSGMADEIFGEQHIDQPIDLRGQFGGKRDDTVGPEGSAEDGP